MNTPISPIEGLSIINLIPGGEQALQQFFEANPLYFYAVQGEPAQPSEAREELFGELPLGYSFTQKYVFGYQVAGGRLVAMANVISNLLAEGVWHVGTFIVETSRHGSGDAQAIYESLEAWAREGGACWMRLGVVEGHSRAEAFWQRCGYFQVTKRHGVSMGRKTNAIRVMAKPLLSQSLQEYYSLVERDLRVS